MSEYTRDELSSELTKFVGFVVMLILAAGSLLLLNQGIPATLIVVVLGVLAGAAVAGFIFGRVLSLIIDGDSNLALVLAWTLFFAWMIPAVGVAVAAALSQIARSASNRRLLLQCFVMLGFIASLIGATVSGLTRFHALESRMVAQGVEYSP